MKVQQYQRQVQEANIAPVQTQGGATAASFGAGDAQSLMGMGKALQDVSQFGEDLAGAVSMGDVNAARDKATQFRNAVTKKLKGGEKYNATTKRFEPIAGEEGYLNRKGAQALDTLDSDAETDFSKLKASFAEGLKGKALEIYTAETNSDFQKAMGYVYEYKKTAIADWTKASRESANQSILDQVQGVLVNPSINDMGIITESVNTGKIDIYRNALANNKDSPSGGVDEAVKAQTAFHKNNLDVIAANKSAALALAYIETYKNDFIPKDYADTKKLYMDAAIEEKVVSQAKAIASLPPEERKAALDSATKNYKDQKQVSALISATNTWIGVIDSAKEEADKNYANSEVEKMLKDPTGYRLPILKNKKVYDGLKSTYDNMIDKKESDPFVLERLYQMSANDPDNYKKLNIPTQFGKSLSPSDMKYFLKDQALNDEDREAEREKRKTINDVVNNQFKGKTTEDAVKRSNARKTIEARFNTAFPDPKDRTGQVGLDNLNQIMIYLSTKDSWIPGFRKTRLEKAVKANVEGERKKAQTPVSIKTPNGETVQGTVVVENGSRFFVTTNGRKFKVK